MEAVISNRFSPETSTPVFFAGRQREITEIVLALTEFSNQHEMTCPPYVHTLQGKEGVGKTTLLKHLKKYALRSNQLNNYLTVYICANDIILNSRNFYLNFFEELIACCQICPAQSSVLNEVFADEEWLRVAAKVAPSFFSIFTKTNPPINNVFAFFSALETFKGKAEEFKQFLALMDWILKKSELFILLLVDHFESLNSEAAYLEFFESFFKEILRFKGRYFVLTGLDDKPLVENRPAFFQKSGGIASLIRHCNFFDLTDLDQFGEQAAELFECLRRGNLFSLFNADGLPVKKISKDLKALSEESYQHISLDCWKRLDNFLCRATDFLMEELKNTLEKCGQVITEESGIIQSCENVKNNNGRNSLHHLQSFIQFLLKIDQALQQSDSPPLLILLENFDKLIVETRSTTTRKISVNSYLLNPGKICIAQSFFCGPFFPFVLLCLYLPQTSLCGCDRAVFP